MQKIRRIGVLSLGVMAAAIDGVLGLVMLPFFLLVGVFGALADQSGGSEAVGAGIMLVIIAIFVPILNAVMGFIIGVIAAFIYNLVAGWTGGLEVELTPAPPQVLPVAGTVGSA
jgi:hypothetical protein